MFVGLRRAAAQKFTRGCALDRHDHAVAARSPGAPYEAPPTQAAQQTPSNMEKMARYTATRPQIQSDFMKQSRGRVPHTTRAHFYDRRYPRDSVPPPPADCPRLSGPAITAFRASVAVDDINGTITATDARGRAHTFYRVACAETRPSVSSTSDKNRSGLKE